MANTFSDINQSCVIALLPKEQADRSSREVIIGSDNSAVPSTIAAQAKVSPLWPNGAEIKYAFISGSANQQRKFMQAADEWVKYTNVSFTNVPPGPETDLRISFIHDGGNWSYLGTDCASSSVGKEAPTMNLASVQDVATVTEQESGIILHILGHALGLVHEHVPVNTALDLKAATDYFSGTQKWSSKTVQAQVIDVYNNFTLSNYPKFDKDSIMKYFFPSALNSGRNSESPNAKLSNYDKAFMVINYPRSSPHPQAPTWTIDFALTVLNWSDIHTGQGILNSAGTPKGLYEMRCDLADGIIQSHVAAQLTFGAGADTDFDSGTIGWCGTDERPSTMLNESGAPGLLTGVLWQDQLWFPGSTIKYCFFDGKTVKTKATALRRQRVRLVLDLYSKYTSLKFQLVDPPIDPSTETARDDCPLRMSFGDPIVRHVTGSKQVIAGYGAIGRTAISRVTDRAVDYRGESEDGCAQPWTTVYFGDQPLVTGDAVDPGADNTLYHELGHFLGLYHEHDNPNLNKDTSRIPLLATLTDKKSVLLYENVALGDGTRSVNANHPSDTDRAVLSLMYPDSGKPGGEFDKALSAFSFSAKEHVALASLVDDALKDATGGKIGTLRAQIGASINKNPRLAVYPTSSLISQTPSLVTGPHLLGAPGDATTPAPATTCPGFLGELLNSLKNFFKPGGNQVFTLQFPGRFLVQSEYSWDTSNAGIFGQFIKPVAVNEAEFRLVDQLYDLPTDDPGSGGVVAGPNGINLSIVYEQLLNNFLPKFVNNGLPKQQEQIRQWLLKEVPVTPWIQGIITRQNAREKAHADTFAASQNLKSSDVQGPNTGGLLQGGASTGSGSDTTSPFPGRNFNFALKADSPTINRIDLCELLMNEYLFAKEDWETERDALINQATMPSIDPATGKATNMSNPASQRALDVLTRQLAHITASRQAQLAAKYSDAVVFGRSHLVQDYMGYLDISSAAEALQAAKNSLRESAMSSLNGSMKVYPVQLTPLDWSQGLSTSFTTEDLTSDPEMLKIAINAKAQQVDTLNAQLVSLRMGQTGDAAALKQQLDAQQKDLDKAQGDLAMKYATNVIQAAKTYLDASGKSKLDSDALAGVSKSTGVAQAILADLPAMMQGVQDAQDKLTATSRAFSQLSAAYALANATDTKAQQEEIQLKIQSLTSELNDLQMRWKLLTIQSGGTPAKTDNTGQTLDPTQPLSLPQEASQGGSRWQTIMFQSTSKSRTDTQASASSASQKAWSVNLWFASASGSSSQAAASSTTTTAATDDTIDLAFRATLVTVDRGGWFQPQFFKESTAYYKINPDVSWVDIKSPDGQSQKDVKGLMPAFPIGFLIAKDIVIRVVHSSSKSTDMKSFDTESSSASGGILCFSYSQSSSSTDQSQSSNFQSFSNGFVVKIPGPQILGYMIETMDPDNSGMMPPDLPPNFFIPDNTTDPVLHAGNPPGPVPPPLGADLPMAPKPTVEVDALRDAINKLIDGKLADIVSQVQHGQEANVSLITKPTAS